jgi:hypothetical protein
LTALSQLVSPLIQVKISQEGRDLVLSPVSDIMAGSLKSGWYNTQKALCTIK